MSLCTVTNFSLDQILWFSRFFVFKWVSFLFTRPTQWYRIIWLAFQESLCFVASCHSIVFSLPRSFAEEDEKKIVCVEGVQEWYREIDEAVRAGVITRCPFPKPDWQTANITQTPGPDRYPPPPTHPHMSTRTHPSPPQIGREPQHPVLPE